jgi:hypothetical protein
MNNSEENNLDIEICDECDSEINCNRNNIYIIIKGEEEKILCHCCFEDCWKEYSNNGWTGDDIEYYLELEKEEK